MTKRNILSVLFASLLVGSCSGPEVRLEKIAPYAVPQIPLEEETLTDLQIGRASCRERVLIQV